MKINTYILRRFERNRIPYQMTKNVGQNTKVTKFFESDENYVRRIIWSDTLFCRMKSIQKSHSKFIYYTPFLFNKNKTIKIYFIKKCVFFSRKFTKFLIFKFLHSYMINTCVSWNHFLDIFSISPLLRKKVISFYCVVFCLSS